MLKSLRLKNFQIHRDLTVPLSPDLTVIVGPSDSGKSAVFRALRWVVEHKPVGQYPTFGTNDTEVSVTSDRGTVSRFKRRGENGYEIDGQKFLAVGTNQPTDVKAALGLSEINLQGQHDGPFLLSLTPGGIARALNDIVDLGSIDKATAAAKKILKDLQAEYTVTERLEEEGRIAVDNLNWVPDAWAFFKMLHGQEQIVSTVRSRLTKYLEIDTASSTVSVELMSVGTAVGAAEGLVEKAKAVSDARTRLTDIKTMARHLSAVTTSLKPLKTAKEAAERLYDQDAALQMRRSLLARLRDLRTKTAAFGPALKALAAARIVDSGYPVIQGTKDRLKVLLDCRGKFAQIEQLNQEIESTVASIQTVQKQVPTCPTCGRPTDE